MKKKTYADVRKLIREELAKGMPDFVMDEIAENAAEQVKRHFVKYAQERSADALSRGKLLDKANLTTKKLEEELRELLKKHAIAFIYNVN